MIAERRSITAIIHTKDEERNVSRAIRSVRPFVREVLVVDMDSSDRTVEFAQREGARILRVPDFGYMEPARAIALAEVSTEWVLICDADEVVPNTLGIELARIVDDDATDVVYLHARTFMFGEEIRGSGWSRAKEGHPKFYRAGAVSDFDEIHRQPTARSGVRVTDLGTTDELCYLHFNYTDVSHFLAKLDRYTTAETLKPNSAGRVVPRVAKEIAWRFIAQRGWRDGWRGALLVHLMVTYRLLAWGKTRLLHELGPEDDIHERYDRIAEAVTSTAVEGDA